MSKKKILLDILIFAIYIAACVFFIRTDDVKAGVDEYKKEIGYAKDF